MPGAAVRPITDEDADAVAALLAAAWGQTLVVGHGTVHDAARLPGFLAKDGGRLVGLLTSTLAHGDLEVVTIDAPKRRRGVGTLLLAAAVADARARGCRRVWLVTTNDNLDALRFYQRRGLRIVAVRPGAVDAARLVKSQIPEVGAYGIPIRDELELELRLA